MNTKFWLVATCLVGLSLASCERKFNNDAPNNKKEEPKKQKPGSSTTTTEGKVSGDPAVPFNIKVKRNGLAFAQFDRQASVQEYRPLYRLEAILNNLEIQGRIPLGETLITTAQLEEIKQEADKIVKQANAQTQRQKHDALLKWVKTNVQYDHGGGRVGELDLKDIVGKPEANTAYTTYKTKTAVCQGYANLLKVMCYTQGINAPVVNGFVYWYGLGSKGGHAWNYAHVDGKWIISDPTNSAVTRFDLGDTSKGALEFQPTRIDFTLEGNQDFECMFVDGEVTISKVKKGRSHAVHIPESLGGFVMSTFLPMEIADGVTEIHLGSKIRNFGNEEGGRHFSSDRPDTGVDRNIARIYVAENNPYIEDYNGILYSKERNKTDQILFIPKRLQEVRLKAGSFDKESKLRHLPGVKKIYFHPDTQRLDGTVIYNCANLEEIHIPKSLKLSEEAQRKLYSACPKNPKIIQF